MGRSHWLWLFSLLLWTLSGCNGTGFPRIPLLGDNIVQRQEAEIHDPYPDSDAGPSVSLRPREVMLQRSEPRRIKESAMRTRAYGDFNKNPTEPAPVDNPNGYQVVPP
ncbi:MAG: hypothetical protein U0903_19625 [Planctomycetales bacterium]